MSLTDQFSPRNPTLQIGKKIAFGLFLSVMIIIIFSIFASEAITKEILGTTLLLMGGVFFLVGSIRDVFSSIIIQKIRKKDINNYFQSDEANYFFGFGKAGEDVVSGVGLIFLSIISSIFL